MRIGESFRRWAFNLMLIAVVSLPLFVVLLELTRGLRGATESSVTIRLGEDALLYAGFFVPYFLGGIIYLAAIEYAGRRRTTPSRWLAIGLAPIVAVGWLVFPVRTSLIEPSIGLNFLISVIAFAVLARQPSTSSLG